MVELGKLEEQRELAESDIQRQSDVYVTSGGARVGWCPEPLKHQRSDQTNTESKV